VKLFWDRKGINKIGLMVEGIIREMPEIYCGIRIDIFVVMPDHVHFIIEINNNFVGVEGNGRDRSVQNARSVQMPVLSKMPVPSKCPFCPKLMSR